MNYLFTQTPLAFFVMDLWRDEAFSYVMSKQDIVDILRTSAQDFAPPFYYIVLHYWMMIFGSSEIALRSLSFATYIMLIFVLFEILVLTYKIPMKRALLYILPVMLNPFLSFYAFEARMYMMTAFLVTLSYYALWKKQKLWYIASITLALYTHYFSFLILIAQILGTYYASIPKIFSLMRFSILKHKLRKMRKRDYINIFASRLTHRFATFYIPVLLFLPWVAYILLYHNFSQSDFWIIQPPIYDIFYMPFMLFTGYERVFGEYYHNGPGYISFHTHISMIVGILVLVPLVINRFVKRSTLNFPYLAHLYLWTLLPPLALFIVSFFATPVYLPRYVIASVPGLLLLAILSFEMIVQLNSIYKTIIAVVLTGVSLIGISSFNTLNIKYHSKRSVSPLLQEVRAVAKDQGKIYVSSELDFHLAQYYIGDEIYIYGKSYEEIPQYVGKSLIPAQNVKQKLPFYPSKAYIIHYDWYEVQSLL